MTPTPVLPVVEVEDGALEVVVMPVRTGEDVEVIEDLSSLVSIVTEVRVGEDVKRIPVYTDAAGVRYVTWEDAFPGS